ncbi:hypothetical protein ACFL3M_03125, partial [Patescibacteria group bacterium]
VYYKRHGDGFHKLSSSDVRALFFRSLAPELEFDGDVINVEGGNLSIHWSIKNKGKGVAKYVQILVGFEGMCHPSFYDEEGNNAWEISAKSSSILSEYPFSFFVKSGIVIHAGQRMVLARIVFHKEPFPNKVKYRILAEGMIPVDGEVDLSKKL